MPSITDRRAQFLAAVAESPDLVPEKDPVSVPEEDRGTIKAIVFRTNGRDTPCGRQQLHDERRDGQRPTGGNSKLGTALRILKVARDGVVAATASQDPDGLADGTPSGSGSRNGIGGENGTGQGFSPLVGNQVWECVIVNQQSAIRKWRADRTNRCGRCARRHSILWPPGKPAKRH